jgi:formate hydrogenlyase subunit 3/multisubunit Na+/H+ antiporter MnhD subunit
MTLALMIVVPLATALLLVVVGSRVGRAASAIAGAGALVIALGAASAVAQAFAVGKPSLLAELGPWLPIRGAAIAFVVDPRTVPLLLATTAVGAGVGIYAAMAMRRDRTALRFFVALDLLVASLVVVLTARDLILMLAGWQGVSVCAYLLFAHERHRPESSFGAARAFVLARAGDAALVVAVFAVLALFQTVDLEQINERLAASAPARPAEGLLAAGILVVLAALVRAGQVPFHAWLPDRSQAQGPSIAAIHALATLSGAFLLIRLAAVLDPVALLAAAGFGVVSAVLGMLAALADRRGSRERWFTVAQLGIAIVACGLESPSAGLLVVGTGIIRSAVVPVADRLPRLARLLSAAGIVAAAAAVAAEAPAAPWLTGIVAVAVLAIADAGLALAGDRIGDFAPAVRIRSVVRRGFAVLERWTTRTSGTAATLVEGGVERPVATIEDALVRISLGVSAAVDGFHRASVWGHEALLLAAAVVIVAYWIVH